MLASFGRNILQYLEGIIYKMLSNTNQVSNVIQQQIGSTFNISPAMQAAMEQWRTMYSGQADYMADGTKSMGLAKGISSLLATTATFEMKVEVSGSARAEWLQLQVNKVLEDIRHNIEYGNGKGGLIFKPYLSADEQLCVDYSQADMFYPLAFESNKKLTAVAFVYWKKIGNYYYTRFEAHRMMPGGYYHVKNVLFRSDSQTYLGSQVSLANVPEWAAINPDEYLENITRPLFGYYRIPRANAIDPHSPLSVSCFADATENIKEADKQYTRLLWEFESGERVLYTDKSAWKIDANGNPILPNKKLYRVLNVAPTSITEPGFYKEWSPELREASIQSGLNKLLRIVEFNCGMSYGIISDPADQALTATEVMSTKQNYYVTVTDMQKKIQAAIEDTIYTMDVYATLYKLAPAGTYKTAFSFDDSFVNDHNAQAKDDLTVVDKGLMSKVEWRMTHKGETEQVAREKLALVTEENTNQFVARINAVRQ